MNELRLESEQLAGDGHILTVLRSDGEVPAGLYENRLFLSLFLQEHMCMTAKLKDDGFEVSDSPLFLSREQVLLAVKEMKLADNVSQRLGYFKTCQKSDPEIVLLRQVVECVADVETVDIKKRTSSFFRICLNQIGDFYVIEDLLFRVRMSLRNEKHMMQLVLSQADSLRKLISLHSKAHKKFLFTFVAFNCGFYICRTGCSQSI